MKMQSLKMDEGFAMNIGTIACMVVAVIFLIMTVIFLLLKDKGAIVVFDKRIYRYNSVCCMAYPLFQGGAF